MILDKLFSFFEDEGKTTTELIEERDHEFRECADTVEVKPGIYASQMCEACRRQAYSFEDFGEQ